jgi:hypothetical protein
MTKDPIIEEVRKAGENLAKESGYNVHSFFNLLREREQRHASRLVSGPVVGYADSGSQQTMAACAEEQEEYEGKGMLR